MALYGWIEVAVSNNNIFQNTAAEDIILRTIKPTNQIVIGNSASNAISTPAAVYINGNNVGIAKQPSNGVQLDVGGMTLLQSCQIGKQAQPSTLSMYGTLAFKNIWNGSNTLNISNSNGDIQFVYEDGTMPLKITNKGGLMINDILLVSNDVVAQGFNMMSDEKLKTDIRDTNPEHDMKMLDTLNVVDFRWLSEYTESNTVVKGFIAQDVQRVFPQAVKDGDVKTIDISQMVALNTSVLKSLMNRINQLEKYMAGY